MPARKVVMALAIGVPVLILGTMFGLYAWGVVSGYRSILAGPRADAVVLGTERCSARAWQCGRNQVAVRLRFQTAEGSQIGFAPASRAPAVGEHVLVQYDREKPARRVIIVREWERDRQFLVWFGVVSAVVLTGVLGLALVLVVGSRRRRARLA